MAPARAWRCVVCGYIHHGDGPPDECPVCGAKRDDFEPFEAGPASSAVTAPHEPTTVFSGRLVIIGGGIAGVTAAEEARKTAPDADIAIVSGEPGLPYYRLNLTRLIAGEITEAELPLHPAEWYDEQHIRLLAGRRAVALEPVARRLHLDDGAVLSYDRLILAPGARPVVPPLPGADLEGIRTLRTHEDAAHILEAAKRRAPFVFIGGGILALEAAAGLRRRGVETAVLERATHLMARQLNERGGRALERHAAATGIRVVTSARVAAIVGARDAEEIRLEDGRRFPAGAIIISAGVRPHVELACSAGLRVANGIVVDDRLRASGADIFAAGDAAEHRGMLYGTWDPARFQGQIAAWNAVGRETEFGGVPPAYTLKVMGVRLFSVGETSGVGLRAIEEESDGGYRAFFFRGSEMVGAILLGDTSAAAGARRAIEFREDFGAWLAKGADIADIAAHLTAPT